MSTLDVAVAALGVNSALTTGVLAYTVRRVSPWPKPPAQPQPKPPKPPAAPGTAAGGTP